MRTYNDSDRDVEKVRIGIQERLAQAHVCGNLEDTCQNSHSGVVVARMGRVVDDLEDEDELEEDHQNTEEDVGEADVVDSRRCLKSVGRLLPLHCRHCVLWSLMRCLIEQLVDAHIREPETMEF